MALYDALDPQRHLLIVDDNRLDDRGDSAPATLSGGAWRVERPLANLQDRRLARVAESVDASAEATRLTIDYGSPTDLRVMVIVSSTVSRSGRCRHLITADAAGADVLHDSGWQDYYPVIYNPWRLPRAHPSFGHGRLSLRDLRRYPRIPWHDVAPQAVLARYQHLLIDDPTNAEGCVRLSRLFTGSGWQTPIPVEWGGALSWEDDTKVVALLSGGSDADRQPARRTLDLDLAGLPEDDAMRLHDLVGATGLSGQLYISYDPTETVHRHRRSMLCRMRALSPIELDHHDWANAGLRFIEEIA
ncbi:hypothetical protein [Pararhodospirillum oryzae]|uniref:Uncharacterized protein n=1 Tax=Pararhodospirillum oryzae TaxID=478448 RepID=A0A512HBN5_9PROT|nr:hypothetical protein [Pararhodospirillum oryzae]GEO82852.1 hypothetical protein ROR02_29830 [Pararhodospirillum oryzae]